MKLKTPSAPFSHVSIMGESISIDTSADFLILPTGNPVKLPLFNEYALTEGRTLTDGTHTFTDDPDTDTGLQNLIYPWIAVYNSTSNLVDFFLFTHRPKNLVCVVSSGIVTSITLYPGNGSIFHGQITYPDLTQTPLKLWDSSLGTVHTETEGVVLTDIAGENTGQTLTPAVVLDSENHTFSEQFIIQNNNIENDPLVIDNCSETTGWSLNYGTGELSIENGRIKFVGTADGSGRVQLIKTITATDLSTYSFVSHKMESSVNALNYFYIASNSSNYIYYSTSQLTANQNTKYIYPLSGTGATKLGTFNPSSTTILRAGISGITGGAAVTLYIDEINADVGKEVVVELLTPDILTATSTLTLQCWTGAAYETVRVDSLVSEFANVSADSTKLEFLNGTLVNDVYGTGLGQAVYIQGGQGETVSGSTGEITYSSEFPGKNRIGLKLYLPPAYGDFSKIKFKTIIDYDPQTNLPAVFNKWDEGSLSKFLQGFGMVI